MAQVMPAGFEAITTTRVARIYMHGMYPKLYGVVVQGKQSSCTMTRAMTSEMMSTMSTTMCLYKLYTSAVAIDTE